MDNTQRRQLHRAHRAISTAETAETARRKARNALLLCLAGAGYGATEMARALNLEPHPWRTVHRVSVQGWISEAAGAPGGAGRTRGRLLAPWQAVELRAAHRALYRAGRAIDAAIDARNEVFVQLYDAGVAVLEQAEVLGVNRNTVQAPVTTRQRGRGVPRNSRNHA